MARERASVYRPGGSKYPMPTLENFDVFHQTLTSVTGAATATAIPATNLSQRRGMFIQNLSATDVYIGGCKPELFAWASGFDKSINATRKVLKWTESGQVSGEFYATTPSGGDPGLETTLIAYAILSEANLKSRTETLLTKGSKGTLSDHEWIFDDNDSLGFTTIYFKDATADPGDSSWFTFISYWRVPTSSAYGLHLGLYDNKFLTLDGSARTFAYASATSNIITVEV